MCPLVLYLQRGVGPLPQPLSDPDTAEVSTRRHVLREAEEVEAEAVLGDVLDGEQPHAQPGPVEVQALLHRHKATTCLCGLLKGVDNVSYKVASVTSMSVERVVIWPMTAGCPSASSGLSASAPSLTKLRSCVCCSSSMVKPAGSERWHRKPTWSGNVRSVR